MYIYWSEIFGHVPARIGRITLISNWVMMVACDFCGDRTAILYCRADSAKLCLPCDHQVHSANALSKKHLRSQVCDNCAAEPSAVRCATDNLVLCQDCDCDAHAACTVSASHQRGPVENFSGCPSVFDLAAAWGLELQVKKTASFGWGALLEELMVPNANYIDSGVKRKTTPSCGKQKQVILKQLLIMLEDGDGDGDGDEVAPSTPSGGAWGQYHGEQQPHDNSNKQQKANARVGGNMTSTQIWDFNLGQLRGHEDTLELEDGGSEILYTVRSYGELLKGVAERGPGVDCLDMIPFSANPTSSQGPATSESNLPFSKQSSNKPKCFGGSKEIQFTDQSILIKCESVTPAITKADLELLAKNRGNAMQRYKEKKKTRRCMCPVAAIEIPATILSSPVASATARFLSNRCAVFSLGVPDPDPPSSFLINTPPLLSLLLLSSFSSVLFCC